MYGFRCLEMRTQSVDTMLRGHSEAAGCYIVPKELICLDSF